MSSSGPSGLQFIGLSDSRFGNNLGRILRGGIGGILLALAAGAAAGVDAVFSVFINPVRAFATQLGNIVGSYLGGIAGIIRAGAITTQQSLLPGAAWAVGPLTFIFSIGVVGAAAYIMVQVLSIPGTSDTIIGSGTDFPLIGTEEETDDD